MLSFIKFLCQLTRHLWRKKSSPREHGFLERFESIPSASKQYGGRAAFESVWFGSLGEVRQTALRSAVSAALCDSGAAADSHAPDVIHKLPIILRRLWLAQGRKHDKSCKVTGDQKGQSQIWSFSCSRAKLIVNLAAHCHSCLVRFNWQGNVLYV